MAENLDALKCGVCGGIYSPNHQNGRWEGCLSMGAPDSPVRQPRHQTVRVRLLEL
jgi:peptide deformylase